jgi:hypothetical protein
VKPLRLGAAVDLERRRIGAYRYIAPGSAEVVDGKVDVMAAWRKYRGESEENEEDSPLDEPREDELEPRDEPREDDDQEDGNGLKP